MEKWKHSTVATSLMSHIPTPASPCIQAVVSPFVSSLNWAALSEFLKLSKRETEITYLLAADFSEAEIAKDLAISARTVHSHVERLYRKLHVRSRCALIVKLFEAWIALGIPPRPTTEPARDSTKALISGRTVRQRIRLTSERR